MKGTRSKIFACSLLHLLCCTCAETIKPRVHQLANAVQEEVHDNAIWDTTWDNTPAATSDDALDEIEGNALGETVVVSDVGRLTSAGVDSNVTTEVQPLSLDEDALSTDTIKTAQSALTPEGKAAEVTGSEVKPTPASTWSTLAQDLLPTTSVVPSGNTRVKKAVFMTMRDGTLTPQVMDRQNPKVDKHITAWYWWVVPTIVIAICMTIVVLYLFTREPSGNFQETHRATPIALCCSLFNECTPRYTGAAAWGWQEDMRFEQKLSEAIQANDEALLYNAVMETEAAMQKGDSQEPPSLQAAKARLQSFARCNVSQNGCFKSCKPPRRD